MYIKLEQHQINNLNAFLDRVEMKGRGEALAMMEIMNAISNASPDEPVEKKE